MMQSLWFAELVEWVVLAGFVEVNRGGFDSNWYLIILVLILIKVSASSSWVTGPISVRLGT